jgi:hypothetical protein
MGILAHVIAAMLYPSCHAYNEEDQEDEMTARVMRILIKDHLKKADYEYKFLHMALTALVNPAVICEVEFVEAVQRIKEKLADGKYKVSEAVDEFLSGVNLNIVPVDQFLIGDFYTNDVQRQPYVVRLRRITYDEARSRYQGKHFIDGVDQFDYVQAGVTRLFLSGQENQTLYDIQWTEADADYVQEATFYYRSEDLQVTFVSGVFMGDEKDVYNSNPFEKRRLVKIKDEWKTIPIYPFSKGYFEPIDPTGRFFYGKSAAFKEFWDDAAQNKMHQIAFDGTYLDVFKPMFISGAAKVDGTVIVPGAAVGMPAGSTATPYALGSNLGAAMQMINKEESDMAESTQDKIMSGVASKGITAYATAKAEQNAQVFLGNFAIMIARLVKEVGELVMDDIIAHTTVGDIDDSIPDNLKVKYKQFVVRDKEDGRDITNKVKFEDIDDLPQDKRDELEWEMFEKHGGINGKTNEFIVSPYQFARSKFTLYIDPTQIVSRSMGTDQMRKDRAFNMLMDPRVAPFVNQEEVITDFVLKEFSDGDPDKYKATEQQKQAVQMGQAPGAGGVTMGALPGGLTPQNYGNNL